MTSDRITLNIYGHVAEMVFQNRPHNHVNVDLLCALADQLEALDANPEIRAVVLASEGKSFCAGADLATHDSMGGVSADPVREFYDQALRLFDCKKPIVAAIQGATIGAGLGLAIAADYRIAAPEARFAANFTKLGFHPGFGLTHTLPRLIGAQRAGLMFMTARRFKAEEMLDWGLVDQIAEGPALRGAALALAQEIAENAPLALLATRQTLRDGLVEAVTEALVHEHGEQSVLRQTADYAEGVSSVFERRPAKFLGR
jgi:enoyl-CoA hydratase/carnithine racemase